MRYVLLFTDGMITVGINDENSGYLVSGKKGWRDAVQTLTDRVRSRGEGKITNLEIQSHGKPGEIVAPGGNITNDEVSLFGGMLAPIMSRGGLIEVMACSVAAVTPRTFKTGGTLKYGDDVLAAYFGGYDKDPVRMEKQKDGSQVVTRLGWKEAAAMRLRFDEMRKQAMSPYENGLEFCLTLARASGAIVRASSLVQGEEFGDNSDTNDGIHITYKTDHFIMRDFDRFGDWDGPVWDFLPDGKVRYLGCSIPRHKVRFPVHPVNTPQQLTYNFREQGGNDPGIGQRPQRMNRNPLPV